MDQINWTNISSFGDIPAQANVASGGTFWVAMLYMVWIILMLILVSYGLEISLTVASFLAMILSLLLFYSDLIGWYHIATFTGITLFMFLYIIYSSSKKQ